MEKVGHSDVPDRNLYIVELENLRTSLVDRQLMDDRRFVCFTVGDFTGLSCDMISQFGKNCIEAGAVYFCVWGPDCSRAHDCIDLARDRDETDENMIPTSLHNADALYEALFFAIFNAFPADAYFSDCTAMVALVLNNSEWSSELRRWMANPEELKAKVLSEF